MVDFSDFDAAKAWIQTKDVKVRCAISSRTSLRILANCINLPAPSFTYITLASLQAILTASCRSQITDQSFVWREFHTSAIPRVAAIRTLLDDEGKQATEHLAAAGLAALSGTDSKSSADSATNSIFAAFAAAEKTGGDVYLASLVAVQKDQELIEDYNEVHASVTKLFSQTLWAGVTPPDPIQSRHDALILAFKGDPIWSFWRDWYEAMWNGTFDDWELAFEVIKIADEVWEGEDAAQKVADEIERIKAELRKPDEEITLEPVAPSNVHKLFETAPVVQASMATLSETLTLRVDVFDRMSRVNEAIPFVETFRALPQTAARIADILAKGQEHDGASSELAIEVGKLRAEVERLKVDLKAALEEIDELHTKPWYKSSSILFAGVTIPTIFSALFLLSGGDDRLEDRWNNVGADIEFLRGQFWPSEEDQHSEPMRLELPDEFEV